MKLEVHYVLKMVHVRKTTEDNLKDFPVVLLAKEMVYNSKEISEHYLYQKYTVTWDTENSKIFVDSTVRYNIKNIPEAKTLNHWVYDSSVETG